MLYSGRDTNESLRTAASIAGTKGWLQFADYCDLREKGLRSEARVKLREFIQQIKLAPSAEQRQFVSWLLDFAYRHETYRLIPHNLKMEVVEPVLVAWVVDEPQNPVPYRWLGGVDHLQHALALDPTDQIARMELIRLWMSWIDYTTHELPYGILCPPAEALDVLEKVEEMLPGVADEGWRTSYKGYVAEERERIRSYVDRRSDSPR